MREDLKLTLNAPVPLRVDLKEVEPLSVQLSNAITPVPVGDYEDLSNKPSINGVELIGAQTSESLHIVSENTTAGWAEIPTYVPKRGEFIIYTDYSENGPGVKVGDGLAYVADLPFIGDSRFEDHINNKVVHITAEERTYWNDKLNCLMNEPNEELILNRN